ncbi:MAG: hypothetical protein HYX76_01425 [Acidobacteria bacterium]|nr:hypothetical protein [Acidobacteriota bacterium]
MCASRALGQQPLVRAQAIFYGDNTEFANAFRDGETLFGVHARLFLVVPLGDRVELRAGIWGHQRFGDRASFELVRPVIALAVRSASGRFIFGTLETGQRTEGVGPDRTTPHGLLPPLQIETLTFTRGHEAGVQWLVNSRRYRHDAWINWQRLNTPAHREKFDVGLVAQLPVKGVVSVAGQLHLVHHGGQLFASGPVSDSLAYGPGLMFSGKVGAIDRMTLELHGLLSRHSPDRERPSLTRDGEAVFVRLAAEKAPWRGHAMVWRACDFIKEEGDPNYLSLRITGQRFKRVRDYAEAGVTRMFHPAPGVELEASARLHRIEHAFEYSYRLLAIVDLAFPVR